MKHVETYYSAIGASSRVQDLFTKGHEAWYRRGKVANTWLVEWIT